MLDSIARAVKLRLGELHTRLPVAAGGVPWRCRPRTDRTLRTYLGVNNGQEKKTCFFRTREALVQPMRFWQAVGMRSLVCPGRTVSLCTVPGTIVNPLTYWLAGRQAHDARTHTSVVVAALRP